MYTLVVDNEKGGVAKTTTAFHLATLAAALGLNTLVVDTDNNRGQTNIWYSRRFNPHKLDTGASTVSKRDILDVICDPEGGIVGATFTYDPKGDRMPRVVAGLPRELQTGHTAGRLDLVPGSRDLYKATELFHGTAHVAALTGALNYVLSQVARTGMYDLAIIDNAPGWDPVTHSSLLAAQGAIIPIEPAPLSVDGLDDYTARVDDANELRANNRLPGKTAVLGVLIARADSSKALAAEMVRRIPTALSSAGIPVWNTVIPDSNAVLQSTSARVPAWAIQPDDAGAQAYIAFGLEVLRKLALV